MKNKKLVIIGGGFAGALIAYKLEDTFDTILIDSKDYFEFTPGILRTLVQPSHIKKIQVLHTHYLKYAKVIKGLVKKIDEKFVYFNNKKIKFDYLVIASGSSYDKIIKQPNSLVANRAKILKEKFKYIVKSKKIIIIGGGIVGVELAAELSTFFKDKNLTIVEYADRLISRSPFKASKYTENFLKRNGVNIIFNNMIVSQKKNYVKTNKGKKLEYEIIFNCIGIKPNSEFMKFNFMNKIDENGFIITNSFLQLEGFKNIFVAGDVANINEEKLAQNAQIYSKLIIKNIRNIEAEKPIKKYQLKSRLMVISLGKFDGLILFKNFVFTGIVPGLLKSLIEWIEMLKYK